MGGEVGQEMVVTTMGVEEAPVVNVTVFNDRAEVTRRVELAAGALPGQTLEVIVQGMTAKADPDSIRVKPEAAKTAGCTILEVSFAVNTVPVTKPSTSSEELEAKLIEQKDLLAAAKAERDRLSTRRSMLAVYSNGVLKPATPQGGDPNTTAILAPPVGMDLTKVTEVLDWHGQQLADLDASEAALKTRKRTIEREVAALEAQLEQLKAPRRGNSTKQSRDVTVLLSATQSDQPIVLLLTYMVRGASWSPSYDIRVDSSDSSLSFTYFGLVSNSTEEDWVNAKLSLSTAKPSKAGMPPAPPSRTIAYKNDWANKPKPKAMRSRMRSGVGEVPMQSVMQRRLSFEAHELVMASMDGAVADLSDESGDEFEYDRAAVATANVTDRGAGAATFGVERAVSILSDNKPHKVTIAMLAMEPELLYFCTPCLETDCYLQCKAKNSSSYPILASQKVSVFFDRSFVTTTQLKDVAPNEEFCTFLGVDAGLRVEHTQINEKSTAGGGWTSAKTHTSHHHYITKVHNTKGVACRLTLVEVLPKSVEDKIKVELIAPASKDLTKSAATRDSDGSSTPRSTTSTPRGGGDSGGRSQVANQPIDLKPAETGSRIERVMQNTVTNNIVWSLWLGADEKMDIPFHYSTTWPADKLIETRS